MKQVFGILGFVCTVAGVTLVICIVIFGKQEGIPVLFVALSLVSVVGLCNAFVVFVLEKRRDVKREGRVQLLIFLERSGTILAQMLTALVAIRYGRIVAVCVPPVLTAAFLFGRWLSEKISHQK